MSMSTNPILQLDSHDLDWFLGFVRYATCENPGYLDLLKMVRGPDAYPRRGAAAVTPEVEADPLFALTDALVQRIGVQQGYLAGPNGVARPTATAPEAAVAATPAPVVAAPRVAGTSATLTSEEAAARLGVTATYVTKLCRRGALTGQRVVTRVFPRATAWRIDAASVDVLLAARRAGTSLAPPLLSRKRRPKGAGVYVASPRQYHESHVLGDRLISSREAVDLLGLSYAGERHAVNYVGSLWHRRLLKGQKRDGRLYLWRSSVEQYKLKYRPRTR